MRTCASPGRARKHAALLAAGLVAMACQAVPETAPEENETRESPAEPSLRPADLSYYVEMRDGVRVAVSFWFPEGRQPAEAFPAILVQTRYGRARMYPRFRRFVEDGYVLVAVDTRGSTSSFGPRRVDIGPAEIEDMDELIAHVASRPWSNGDVFAQGTSYMADTADIATSRPADALKGAVIRQVDFDVFLHLFFPGGVANQWFLDGWGGATRAMDEGRSPDPESDLNCLERAADCAELWPLLAPVDEDDDFSLLRQALAGRERWVPGDYAMTEFHDDAGRTGFGFFDSAPAAQLEGIRREAKPAQVWGSWMDAGTAEAALARYRSAPDVPMELWITGNDHGNSQLADPFMPAEEAPRPSLDEQHRIMAGFYEAVADGEFHRRIINYYVLGAGVFRQTPVWPPTEAVVEAFFFDAGGALVRDKPAAGSDAYEVDFSAGTGPTTRWSTQFGTAPDYPDRRAEDRKLLVYDSAPFAEDAEVAGTPVIELHVASATADPVFHVYLEDVSPDGRVTYLTEGAFRAIHRAPADPAALPYDMGPAPHSYRRADSLPVVPGERMEVRFALFPVAALVRAGHRLRVAIAGTDQSYFRRYSEGRDDTFRVSRGGEHASAISVPLRPAAGD